MLYPVCAFWGVDLFYCQVRMLISAGMSTTQIYRITGIGSFKSTYIHTAL